MKIGEFFLKLFSADGEVSSKRVFGGMLITAFVGCLVVAVVKGDVSATVESLMKTDLYTGASLLGINVAETIIQTVKRPVAVEVKEDVE